MRLIRNLAICAAVVYIGLENSESYLARQEELDREYGRLRDGKDSFRIPELRNRQRGLLRTPGRKLAEILYY